MFVGAVRRPRRARCRPRGYIESRRRRGLLHPETGAARRLLRCTDAGPLCVRGRKNLRGRRGCRRDRLRWNGRQVSRRYMAVVLGTVGASAMGMSAVGLDAADLGFFSRHLTARWARVLCLFLRPERLAVLRHDFLGDSQRMRDQDALLTELKARWIAAAVHVALVDQGLDARPRRHVRAPRRPDRLAGRRQAAATQRRRAHRARASARYLVVMVAVRLRARDQLRLADPRVFVVLIEHLGVQP